MKDTALGGHNEYLCRVIDAILQKSRSTAYLVGKFHHRALALWMYQYLGIRILLLQFQYLLHREFLMHMTCTVPKEHVPARYTIYISTQVAVGAEDDGSVLRERLHYLAGIAAGHHYVGNGLGGSRGVYITYNGMTRMLCHELCKLVGRATLRQGAGSLQIGNKDFLVGTEYLACFAHKVHATHYYYISIGGCSLLCQSQ